jgi:hypothetical protein
MTLQFDVEVHVRRIWERDMGMRRAGVTIHEEPRPASCEPHNSWGLRIEGGTPEQRDRLIQAATDFAAGYIVGRQSVPKG